MKVIRSTEEALQMFEESSIKYEAAMNDAKPRVANRHYDVFTSCISYLHKHGDLFCLQKLFDHPNQVVRINAAYALLRFRQVKSEAILREIANNGMGYAKLDATLTLEYWLKGELHFPFEPIFYRSSEKDDSDDEA